MIDPLSPNHDFIISLIFMDTEKINEFLIILNDVLSNDKLLSRIQWIIFYTELEYCVVCEVEFYLSIFDIITECKYCVVLVISCLGEKIRGNVGICCVV